MKVIEIGKANKTLADYAQRVGREPVVVFKDGKPLAVLSSAEGMDAESISLANNPKFVAIIQRSRLRHEREGGISLEEVRRRLGIRPAKPRRRKKSASR
jgi:PHD/YefM family antitoxin component YafN of YafNO toxin-antitoxin module